MFNVNASTLNAERLTSCLASFVVIVLCSMLGSVLWSFHNWWSEPSVQPLPQRALCRITTIPPEIVVEIFKLLEYEAILRVRKTCKFLYHVTKTRAIWLHFIRQSMESFPGIFPLEKPVIMYSSKELESMFLRWKSTEVAWKKDDAALIRQRDITIEDDYACSHLVPGGRWLLVVLENGQVCYYDLDSSAMERKHLIDAQIEENDFAGVKMSVDMSNPVPISSFKLALHVSEYRANKPGAFQVIKIWGIDFVIEGQDVIGLKATRLKSLCMHQDTFHHIRVISLLGRDIAFSVSCAGNSLDYTFVVTWPDIKDESLDYPRKLLDPIGVGVTEMHLLPNERLITVFTGTIYLYDYSNVREIFSVPKKPPLGCRIEPTWEVDTYNSARLSLPFLLPGSVRVIALVRHSLFDITIDSQRGVPGPTFNAPVVRVIPLSKMYYFDRGNTAQSLGYNRGALIQISSDATELSLLEYQRRKETMDPVAFTVRTIKTSSPPIHRPFFDEGSGRVVACFRDQISVLDLALTH